MQIFHAAAKVEAGGTLLSNLIETAELEGSIRCKVPPEPVAIAAMPGARVDVSSTYLRRPNIRDDEFYR